MPKCGQQPSCNFVLEYLNIFWNYVEWLNVREFAAAASYDDTHDRRDDVLQLRCVSQRAIMMDFIWFGNSGYE